MRLSNVSKVDDSSGPGLTATFTADRSLRVDGSPANLFEVLYLKDGVIVGGGPMLNQPGDLTPQAMPLIGAGFHVDPDNPWTMDLGPRHRLCPALSWPESWSEPQRYEAVLVQGRVFPGQETR